MRYLINGLIFLIIICFVLGCQHDEVGLRIISNQEKVKTESHQRIMGTRVFAIIPETYNYNKTLDRFQASANQHVKFAKINNVSFSNMRDNFISKEKSAMYERIQLHGYDGYYNEFKNPTSGDAVITMFFGDEDFTIMVIGQSSGETADGYAQLQRIIQSTYYDKDFDLDNLERASFTFDESICEFIPISNSTETYVYVMDKNIGFTPEAKNCVMVFEKLSERNVEEAEMHFKTMMKRNKNAKMEFEKNTLDKVKIGDYDALLLETKFQQNDVSGIMYYVQLSDENNSLAFTGLAYQDLESLSTKFKRTIESLRFK